MRLGFRAVGSACYQVLSHLAVSFGGNLLAMLLSLPIVLVLIVVAFYVHSLSVVPLGIAVLVGALPNPACMGLQALARELAHGHAPDFGEQWQALRTYWRVGLKAWLIAAATTIVCALNVAFYATRAANPASGLHAVAAPLFLVWTLFLLFWLGIHLYVAPLLLAQVEPRALRQFHRIGQLFGPADFTARRPIAPSVPVPVRTTAIERDPRDCAIDSKRTSAEGRTK